jgi:hypothetical protein
MTRSTITVRLRHEHMPCPPRNGATATVRESRVYPDSGHFLKFVALSNIEMYPTTCGWTGFMRRFIPLRSRPGILVTMQSPMKSAQSMLAQLQPAGNQAWSAQ